MSQRIESCFVNAASEGRKLLIPYVTAGDPNLDATLALMHQMVSDGADIIELGVPFSDPMADGPVIQAACERALSAGTTLSDILALVEQFRQSNTETPIVLMGYMNPVEIMGHEAFAQRASAAGVDGVLIVDLPPEEGEELIDVLKAHGLDTIFLLSPNTPDYRVKKVCDLVSGYVYYVSLKGVTGAATLDTTEVSERVSTIKSLSNVPVAVGFGIRDADSAKAVGAVADAVVVGSAFVTLVGEHGDDQSAILSSVGGLLASMRQGLDSLSQ